jgi:hypothetical protein
MAFPALAHPAPSHPAPARRGLYLSLTALGLLAGCVATVRVPGPPPPAYAPPPPPAYAPPPAAAPAVEIEVQATEPPPPLPDYEQPPCPEDGWLWTPGYWAYSTGGYYWIPGTWVAPPAVGVLWTPGYWGFVGGVYAFHAGYWGPHVGFYGGVNYGFGYGGVGFVGGHWAGNSFAYNTAVVRVNTTVIHNTYVNNTVINNVTVNKVSYNGGTGGVAAQPTPQERAATSEPHTPPTPVQKQHVQEAVRNPQLSAKANGGHPAIAATARPAAFSGPGVVSAKGAPPLKPVAPPAHTPAAAAAGGQHPQPNESHPQTVPSRAPVSEAHPQAENPRAPVRETHPQTETPRGPVSAAHPPAPRAAARSAPPPPKAAAPKQPPKKAPEKREGEPK